MLRNKTTIVIASFLFLILIFLFWIFFLPNQFYAHEEKIVTIPKGISFRATVDSLANAGIIRSKWAFKIAGRLLGYTRDIKNGKYLFSPGSSNLQILKDLKEGTSRVIIIVTIPEGWRIEKIAQRYAHELGINEKRFIALCYDKDFIKSHDIDAPSLEGYLLPSTYSFYWQTEEEYIIERMIDVFKHFYNDTLIKRQQELGMTQLEILTLASIIEAESGVDIERPIISGVYWNRLRRKMRLEADPTVQYALGKEKRLLHRDLKINSPYNTYINYGLPPGPINNPGKSSILAALYPQQHGYLYFVATGTGGHYFAKSFQEHQKNIRLYQRTRRELRKLSQR